MAGEPETVYDIVTSKGYGMVTLSTLYTTTGMVWVAVFNHDGRMLKGRAREPGDAVEGLLSQPLAAPAPNSKETP